MTKEQKEFLNKFADLCEKYKAEFYYTTDDDGINISVDGETVFVDFLSGNFSAKIKDKAK